MKNWIKENGGAICGIIMGVLVAAAFVAPLAWMVYDTETAVTWSIYRVPTTDKERTAVAEMVQRIMSATPRTLSGHDQDWDDAIKAATKSATETLCRPTMWESRGGVRTGRWKYVEEVGK